MTSQTQTKPKTYFSDPLVVTQLGGGKKDA
jgi:hypothetical protein